MYEYQPYTRASLVLEYSESINASEKQLVWFDGSGHFPFFEERQKFAEELVNRVLPLGN